MIEARQLIKKFNNEPVVEGFSLSIHPGDFIAITGESGKGKTTILNMIGLLEKPDGGEIIVEGVTNPNKKQKMLLQRHKFGYLFQNYALIENESVEHNLKIALEYQKRANKNSAMKEALEFVGLRGMMKKKIYQLSGGEQQRVALARVYLKQADYIFADEPTGNLDLKNRDKVFGLLKKMNDEGKAIIFVTHDKELAKQAHREIIL